MSVAAFLAELRSRDIRVWMDGDQLRCNAPAGVLTPDLRDQLRRRKAAILEFLRSAETLARQERAIVPLQPRGERVPVFAVAGHNGDVFCYRALARHLGDDQPFFGLQPPGLDAHGEPLTRVEELAAYFAAQIRAFRPDGPYVITGYCAGGPVAFELARQLLQEGAAVSFVALFASVYPTSHRFLPRLVYWGKRVVVHSRALASLSSFEERRRYLGKRLRDRLQSVRDARAPATGDDPMLVQRAKVGDATVGAVRRYAPGRFDGRVGLFLPGPEWAARYRDATLGWRSVAPHVEEYLGPDGCHHSNMLLEPHVLAVAESFRLYRERSGTLAGRG